MKTLEKLKLHNLGEIGVAEQKRMRGGGSDEIIPGGLLGEVEVYAPYKNDQYYYFGGGATHYSDGLNGFSGGGGVNTSIYGSDQGPDQIWSLFRGYSGSDVPGNIDEQNTGGGTDEFHNNLTLSTKGISFLKSWEKGPDGVVALMPYDDNGSLPGGNMTIGWGHRIKANENFTFGITEEQANTMFLADIQISINDVNNSVHVTLTQSQFDALVSYSFNTGGLINSPSCLTKLNNGDYAGAAAEMDIVTQNNITLRGLVTRRSDEQTMFNDGLYYNHN